MQQRRYQGTLLWFTFGLAALSLHGTVALADGGAVRALATDGGLKISVFTSPVVLSAGEVDVSVLVQDAQTMANLPEAIVEVELTPKGRPYASQRVPLEPGQATNKLFQACHVALDEGVYDVVVLAEIGTRRGRAEFAVSVGPQPTPAAAFWPWFTWPAVPIVLWIVHLFFPTRRNESTLTTTNRGAGT